MKVYEVLTFNVPLSPIIKTRIPWLAADVDRLEGETASLRRSSSSAEKRLII